MVAFEVAKECMLILAIGTFARVWLVRLANPRPEDRDKVFALKVLRKVEGAKFRAESRSLAALLTTGSHKTQTG